MLFVNFLKKNAEAGQAFPTSGIHMEEVGGLRRVVFS